jgi:hypothetical protein
MGQLSFGNPDRFLHHDMLTKGLYDRGRFLTDWFCLRGRGMMSKTAGIHSTVYIIIILLLVLSVIILSILCVKQYRNNRRMKILQLNSSYNFMQDIYLKQNSVELRAASAAVLGAMESGAAAAGMGDYQTVKTLLHLVSQMPPDAPYFDDIAREVRELRVSWNTTDRQWAVNILSDNAEKIISDIRARMNVKTSDPSS